MIVDQMDQVAGQAVGAAFIQLIKRMIGRDGCKIIIACRTYEAQSTAFVENLALPELTIHEIPPEIVCDCLQRLNLGPEVRMVRFCGNILNLFLLASLVHEGVSVSDISAEGQLWNKLRDRLSHDRQDGLVEAACDFATEAVSSEGGRFCVTSRQACAERLSSWGILSAYAGGLHGFRHERLRDYFVAYDSVIRREESLSDLLNRIRTTVRSKTILPWMLQIAADLRPEYCTSLIAEVFDEKRISSDFPRRACIDSIVMIQEPTPQLARALWLAAKKQRTSDEIKVPLGTTTSWAIAFWKAGLFTSAARSSPDYRHGGPEENLLEHLPVIAQQFPEDVICWIAGLESPPPNLRAIVEALLVCPTDIISKTVGKLTKWIKTVDDIHDGPVHQLVRRFAETGHIDLAVSLLDASTEPFLWQTRPKPPHTPDTYLRERCHGMFMHMMHLEDREETESLFGVPCDQLVSVFRRHILRAKEIASSAGYKEVGDQYMRWGDLRNLFSPGRTDCGEEWILWYGLLRIVALGALKSNPKRGRAFIEELISSEDLLEARIGLDLLGKFKRVPESLLILATRKGLFREPASLGESIRVFAKFLTPTQKSRASELAVDLEAAIKILDRDRPTFLTLGYFLPKILIRWAEQVALGRSSEIVDAPSISVACFVFALRDRFSDRMRNWTFHDLAKCCAIYNEVGVRPTGWASDMTGRRYVDAEREWVSLHSAADRLKNTIAERFPYLLRSAFGLTEEWIESPIGYAVLHGLQWRTLERKGGDEYRYGYPCKSTVQRVLRTYAPIIESNDKYACAIRSQFAGLLGMMCSGMPIADLRGLLPNFKAALHGLCISREGGCVQSWGNLHHFTHHPPSVAAKAVNALIHCAWRDRFGDSDPNVELWNRATGAASQQKEITKEMLTLPDEDRIHIEKAYASSGEHQIDVIRVLGNRVVPLSILDGDFVGSLLSFLSKSEMSLCHSFVEHVSHREMAWLLYPKFRALYERYLEQEDIGIPEGCVWHMAIAVLIGWEDLGKEGCLLSRLLTRFDGKNRRSALESVCDAYDWLGGHSDHWPKVRALWQEAVDRSKHGDSTETAAFWRCFEKGRRSILGNNNHIELRVSENLASLAELLESTCIALSSDPTYQTERRQSVLRYLADQSFGQEPLAVRLLALCVDVHGENYADLVVQREPSLTILRNAIVAGDEAKRIAEEIIERHELSSQESLAGLLM